MNKNLEKFTPVDQTMLEKMHIATCGVTYYIYCESAASWMQVYSKVASRKLLSITNTTLRSSIRIHTPRDIRVGEEDRPSRLAGVP